MNDSTKISKLQKLRDEAKKYRDEAKKYMNEAKKYRDEILKLVDTSKASSKTCIDTSKIINTDKDSMDEKIIEETIKVIDNNDSINEKIIEEAIKVMDNDSIDEKIITIKKDNRLAIFEGTKPNIGKDAKPNINKGTKPNIKIIKNHR